MAFFEFGKFFRFEAVVEHTLHLIFQSLYVGLRLGVEFVNLFRNAAVDIGAREFFEQGRLVVAAGFEKIGKTVLRQQHGARELRVVQAHGIAHGIVDLALAERLLFGREATQGTLHAVVGARAFQAHRPASLVARAVGRGKDNGSTAVLLSAAQYAAHVARLNRLPFVVARF